MFEDQLGVIKDLGDEGETSVDFFIRIVLTVTKNIFAAIHFDIIATSRSKVFDGGLEGIQAEKVSKIFSDEMCTVTTGFRKGTPQGSVIGIQPDGFFDISLIYALQPLVNHDTSLAIFHCGLRPIYYRKDDDK